MAVNRDFAKNYNLQGGELFFKLQGSTNYAYFGATNEFKLNFKSSTLEHKNSETDTIVTDMEVTKEVEASLSFTTEDLNKDVLALAFSGKATTTTQDAKTNQEVTFASVGAKSVYEVGDRKLLNVVVKYDEDKDEDIVAIEGVDYTLKSVFGTIEIAQDSALVGKDIKVTYDCEAQELTTFSSLDETSREFSLRFLSSPKAGQPKETTVHRVRLSLNGDYSLKGLDKLTSLSFTGKVLLDSTKPEGKQFVETVMIGA